MPSVLTHYGFNCEVFDDKIEFLKNNKDIFLVGAQGPDPFFFKGLVPSIKSVHGSFVRKFGSRLHKIEPSEIFEFFFNYANKSVDKDVLYAYVLGAGLHYILDRKIHPYVYYQTGFSDDKKKKAKYFVDHTLFETNMDVLLINGRYKKYKVKPVEAIKCDLDKIEKVSKMYGCLSKETFIENHVDENSFRSAYKNMVTIEKFLYSKRGIKKKIVSLLLKNTPINTMMHSKVVKDDNEIDYLNLKKKEWKDPCDKISYNKDVIELIEEAKKEANGWIEIVIDSHKGYVSLERIKNFVKDMIYDGYNYKDKMKVFNNVFERKERKK